MSGRKAVLNRVTLLRDRFRAQDKEDYVRERELSSARAWTSVILAGKWNVIAVVILPRGFSENAVAAKIS